MVTSKGDSSANFVKMNRKSGGSMASTSSGFRLLDSDQNNNFDTISSISRNSIYKQKIDLMFDDNRSVASHNLLDDRTIRSSIQGSMRNGSVRTRRSSRSGTYSVSGGLGGSAGVHHPGDSASGGSGERRRSENGGGRSGDESRRVHNQVQAQIEKMFTDVAKDTSSCSFPVRCLGALPLKDKVTSLLGLQEPLRQLYLSGAGHGIQNAGTLDISTKGLRVRLSSGRESFVTPFHNIAVWSAVKFVVSASEGGAAFLPLITDPENIDKRSLFQPLTAADKRRLSSGLHAPIVAVVMRSMGVPKQLECHGFVCQTPEDAIVIAATLYQSLMAHMSNGAPANRTKRPKNRNGISCMSIASSSATTNNNLNVTLSSFQPSVKKSLSQRSKSGPNRPPRKKRSATSSLSGESDAIRELVETETSTEERKKKSSKSKRAPPVPLLPPPGNTRATRTDMSSMTAFLREQSTRNGNPLISDPILNEPPYQSNDASGGDILTRVAIPRSGSFLNTGGLTRYKSRATRRTPGKIGGGGGSPLGFSELFNEFKLQENLHSLDDILNAIIDSDGMSFNDLKPIYKEFLLKLAVTLTKDELYQRSKSIMRRQKKKKLRKKNNSSSGNGSGQSPRKKLLFGAKSLRKVFHFGKFRKSKSAKTTTSASLATKTKSHQLITAEALSKNRISHLDSHRGVRATTSGSDVSELRHETTMHGQNRNSSSGYVSCSECSYDSEACTCTSADRCYCSLGADHDVAAKLEATKNQQQRSSTYSCETEDKCYCSMTEASQSQSTCCDSDSCLSTSKCYCHRGGAGGCRDGVSGGRKAHSHHASHRSSHSHSDNNNHYANSEHDSGHPSSHAKRSSCKKGKDGAKEEKRKSSKKEKSKEGKSSRRDNLGLDYELFTVSGSKTAKSSGSAHTGKSVKAAEALSVKKSVEAAAIFADVKLSQTTDITTLVSSSSGSESTQKRSSGGSVKINNLNAERGGHRESIYGITKSDMSVMLREKSQMKVRVGGGGVESIYGSTNGRPVSASGLEDSLGYLP